MGRVAESCVAMVGLIFPVVSAASDYQNALDEDIAMYILIGIAAVYFAFTAVLLILAVCCCCCRKVIQPKTKPAPDSLDSEKPPLTVKPLPTIHEVEEPATTPRSQPQRRRTGSQRRRARIPSDQEELIMSEEGSSQPPSPIETTPTAPQPPPPQPIQQTPDPRKKKAHQATPQQTPPVAREPPRLPGAASPLEKNTPEPQRKEVPHLKPTTELPPLRNTPPVAKKHTGPEAAAYDFYSSRLAPIQREPNKRLESPRMQQRRKQLTTTTSPSDIAMTSLSKRGGDLSDSSAEDLGAFVSQLNIDEEFQTPATYKKKKTHLDTSFTIQNKGFVVENTVGLLALRKELEPISQYWYQIGMGAKIPRDKLQLLRKVCGKSHEDGLWKMCQMWVDLEPGLTWEGVVKALQGRELGNQAVEVSREIKIKKLHLDSSPVRTPDRSTNSDNSLTLL